MLSVVTNDKFKKAFEPRCRVQMKDSVDTFTDFVAVGFNSETCRTTMLKNTDALTLGHAAVMTVIAFKEAMSELSSEQREEILEALEA